MKKIIHTLILAFLAIAWGSCEKNTGVIIPDSSIIVTDANVIFETTGGEGYIKVETSEAIEVESNQDWCVASVSDKTIRLNVSPNTGMGGRTAVITIRSASGSITVTAVQTAAVMWLKDFQESISFAAEGATVKSAVISSFPVSVKSSPDWITYRLENDSLYLTASASGPRKGTIVFSSQGREMSYDLVQVAYVSFLGEWEMKFFNPSNSNTETAAVVLSQKVAGQSFMLDNLVISGTHIAQIELAFNPNTNNVTLSAGQYLATIGSNFVYLALRSSAGSYGYATTYQLAGIFNLTDDGTATYTFVDNGTWSSVAGGFGFYVFNGQPPSSSTATGSSYRRFMNVVMTKK